MGLLEGKYCSIGSAALHYSCFTCQACKLPIEGSYSTGKEDGLHYHSQCYKERFGKRCAACGLLLEGGYTQVAGRSLHHHCHVCKACKAPIVESKFKLEGVESYHSTCHREKFDPRCDVCAELLPLVKRHPARLQELSCCCCCCCFDRYRLLMVCTSCHADYNARPLPQLAESSYVCLTLQCKCDVHIKTASAPQNALCLSAAAVSVHCCGASLPPCHIIPHPIASVLAVACLSQNACLHSVLSLAWHAPSFCRSWSLLVNHLY